MEKLFIEILNMTLPATLLIIALMVFRRIFNKLPKNVNLFMWAMVFVRLLLPIKIESSISLMPRKSTIPENIMTAPKPEINSGIDFVNNAVNPILSESFAPNPGDSANPMQVVMFVAANIWVVGIIAMIIYALISFILLKRKVSASVLSKENIYYCDYIESPFVLGIIKPKIYLPSGISEKEAELVILHEKAHIKRFDHITKMLGFFALSVHWFNPFVLIAYLLFARDIESAADEKVIKETDLSFKKEYSETLLNLSSKRTMLVCPLAFGEIGVKERVKSVLSFKKPTVWIIILSIILCVSLIITFMTVPKDNDTYSITGVGGADNSLLNIEKTEEKYPQYFGLNTENGVTVYVWQMAGKTYSCGLLSGKDVEHSNDVLWNLKGTSVAEMKNILKSYNIKKDDIRVKPLVMPYSSYYYNVDLEYIKGLYRIFELYGNANMKKDIALFNSGTYKFNGFSALSDLKYGETFHVNGQIKTEQLVWNGIVTKNTYREDGTLKESVVYGSDGATVESYFFDNGNLCQQIHINNTGDRIEYTFDIEGDKIWESITYANGEYTVYNFNEYGEALLSERVLYQEDGKKRHEIYNSNGKINMATIIGDNGEIEEDIHYDDYGLEIRRVKNEVIAFSSSHHYDLVFTEGLKCEFVYTIETNYFPLDTVYSNSGEFSIYAGNMLEYQAYMQRKGYGYAKPETDGKFKETSYILKECKVSENVYEMRFPFDIGAVYGELIPGTYKLRTVIDFTDVNGRPRKEYVNLEFAITE